jgi:hypothetical protein
MALGVSFKAAELESGVSEPVINRFYTAWTAWLVETKYESIVRPQQTIDELSRTHGVFEALGLPGCISSMDGVHVAWDNCPSRYVHLFKGKEGYPTVAFNVHCDHVGRVLAVNGPHPGARNDKNMARLDDMLKAVRESPLFSTFSFSLRKIAGAVIHHTGAWVLCDGGYHKWRATICGFKHSPDQECHRWSKR